MSKYFELLQNLGKDRRAFETDSLDVRMKDRAPSATIPVNLPGAELHQINELVQRLILQAGVDAPRTIVFTGTEPGNGCSWVCAHAGVVLANQVSASVCLVDGNLRAPTLHNHLGIANEHGLGDALGEEEPIRRFVHATTRHNLLLLTAGSAGNKQPSLSSARMRLRMTELRAQYDYVLIDAAALSVSEDAVALGSLADGVVLVLKANSSRRETARKAVEDLRAAEAKVLGVVLNQRTFPIPDKIYKKL